MHGSRSKKLILACDSNAGEKTKAAVDILAQDMSKAGFDVTAITVNAETDLAQYNQYNLIAVGAAGAEGAALKSSLTGTKNTEYRLKTEVSEGMFRIWAVGSSDYSEVHALQIFYSENVKNGRFSMPTHASDIHNEPYLERDPGIIYYNGMYYSYANNGNGYAVYASSTIHEIYRSAKKAVFIADDYADFEGGGSYWAPEAHYYNGFFYLFGTYLNKNTGIRGTAVFRAETPEGPFEPWSDGFLTPSGEHSIDGTLYIDTDGTPYMVYVDEWIGNSDRIGRMAYVQLSKDLKKTVGEYHTDMFRSTDPVWTVDEITDGPWMYRCENGDLLMLWSTRDSNNYYCVGVAKSSNGRLDGVWTHSDKPLFTLDNSNIYCTLDGGHPCVFETSEGRIYLAVHYANDDSGETTVLLIPLTENDGMLYIDTVQ